MIFVPAASSDVASSCSFEMKPAEEKKAEMAESMDEKPAAESGTREGL